jgi:TRAP-type C4-dicarboxylate transport system permease large subunit
MILITVPVVLPLVTSLGYSGVWFGIFVTVLAEAGLITPPVGLNVFVIRSQIPELPLGTIFRGAMNFLAADAVLLVLLIAFPAIALWLPAVFKM